MTFKKTLYNRLNRINPQGWKFYRKVIYGKVNFNDLKEWEKSYKLISSEEILKLQNRIPNLVNKAIELTYKKNPSSILDVSAGFGNYLIKLDNNIKKHATEFSDSAISYLLHQGIKTEKAILPHLPFKNNEFDIVVSISVFEHLKDEHEIQNSFKECHRICRQGFIFSVPFECMQPWKKLIHNYNFTYNNIEAFTQDLFTIEEFSVVKDNITTRCIAFLKKI